MSIQDNPTFNLCGYELRVQDYQQILYWARNINIDPEKVMAPIKLKTILENIFLQNLEVNPVKAKAPHVQINKL